MTTVELFDGQSCCGPSGDAEQTAKDVARFVADADWLAANDVVVARLTLSSEPLAFAMNPDVSALLQREGAKGLPALVIDGKVVMSGRYPTRAELAQLCGIDDLGGETAEAEVAAPAVTGSGCCTPAAAPSGTGCCGGPVSASIEPAPHERG